jgi:hypothetical protein
MDAALRAKIKAWPERYEATRAMVNATEHGDVKKAKELLSRFPLLDHWIPYNARCWSQLAAAAGQLELMKFWHDREKTTRPVKMRASPESLLFWAMGDQYINPDHGNPIRVAEHLLNTGANIEGDSKDYTPLHRAIFLNRPELLKLLIRRGANLSRRYATGESALQIAKRILNGDECVTLLEHAGAPLQLPKKPERPKPVRTVDLRTSAKKLEARIESAVRSFARQHRRELVTAIALASVPHEGYVMVAFDTGKFEGNPWDCAYNEFSYIKFPDWTAAHEGDSMRLIDLDGRTRENEPDAFLTRFKQMIVTVLASVQQNGAFDALNTTKDCRIGIEMTSAGEGKFWKLHHRKPSKHAVSR